MPLLVRTRMTALEPHALALTVRGEARIRVRGQVCGYVQCAGQRRWAWGAFDETFQVARGQGTLTVWAIGLAGAASETLRFSTEADLTLPQLPSMRGKVGWRRTHVPPLSPLDLQTIRELGGPERP